MLAARQPIRQNVQGPPLARAAAHNPDNPTLKSWAAEALGVPGITFETGDATDPHRLETLAAIAAEEAMKLLLERRALSAAGSPLSRPAEPCWESRSPAP